MAKKREYKLNIKDLPEDLTKEDLEKISAGLMTQLSLSKLAIKKPVAAGDCDCWSYTACACKCAS